MHPFVFRMVVFVFLPNICLFRYCDKTKNPSLLYRFEIKTDGTKTVVAGNHCGFRVLHPTVVKVSSTVCKRFRERTNTLPRALAKTLRTFSVLGHEHFSDADVASVFDRILVQIRKVFIFRFSNCRNSYFFHTAKYKLPDCESQYKNRLYTHYTKSKFPK